MHLFLYIRQATIGEGNKNKDEMMMVMLNGRRGQNGSKCYQISLIFHYPPVTVHREVVVRMKLGATTYKIKEYQGPGIIKGDFSFAYLLADHRHYQEDSDLPFSSFLLPKSPAE